MFPVTSLLPIIFIMIIGYSTLKKGVIDNIVYLRYVSILFGTPSMAQRPIENQNLEGRQLRKDSGIALYRIAWVKWVEERQQKMSSSCY